MRGDLQTNWEKGGWSTLALPTYVIRNAENKGHMKTPSRKLTLFADYFQSVVPGLFYILLLSKPLVNGRT